MTREDWAQIICDALWGKRDFAYRNDEVKEAGLRVADAVLSHLRAPPQTVGWQPIETAPKDGTTILVVGQPSQIEGVKIGHGTFTAYWDDIDSSFCLSAATWLGPFIKPTHWQPLPDTTSLSRPHDRSGS